MATSRIARFVTEAAPPQFVTVMRHRTSKVLDTIKEEDRDANRERSSNSSSSSSPKVSSGSSAQPEAAAAAAYSSPASAMDYSSSANSKCVLRGFHRSFAIFEK